jgi:DNA-binding transcriptional ArsR family regulator
MEMLAQAGELPATDIYEHFRVSHPAISQHLKVLREAGLVLVEKQAQRRLYRLNPQPMHELGAWVQQLTNVWEKRYTALDRVLLEEQQKLTGTEKENKK